MRFSTVSASGRAACPRRFSALLPNGPERRSCRPDDQNNCCTNPQREPGAGNSPTPGAAAKLQTGPQADPAQSIPLGHVGEHAELANLGAFHMSDLAAYINREVITRDRGKGLGNNGIEDLFVWLPARWDALPPNKWRSG